MSTLGLSCRFGGNPISAGIFISSSEIDCEAPPTGQPGAVAVEITENGVDFTNNKVLFDYTTSRNKKIKLIV